MEPIKSKANDTSNLEHDTQDRELQDNELDEVTGGLVVISIIGILVG